MMKPAFFRRGTSAMAAVLLLLSAASPAFAAATDGVVPTADEAYYVTLDHYGSPKEASIVKSWQLNGAKQFTDYGSYSSVSNLTDRTEPLIKDGTVTFSFGDSAPERFYFEGKTDEPFKKLPWNLSLSYRLNGVPKKAEDLAGEKGVVEIRIAAHPNLKASAYARNNYLLTCVAAFNLDDILSLEAPDAQIQTIGNLRAAAFLWLPGEDREYALRIGTESFETDGLTFIMGPLNSGRLADITELREKKEEIQDSWDDMNAAVDEVLDSLDSMKSDLHYAADGLGELDAVREDINNKKSRFYGDLDSFLGDMDGLSSALSPLSGHVNAANNTVADVRSNLTELNETLLKTRRDLDDTRSILKSVEKDMTHLGDTASDLDRQMHHVHSDVNRIQGISRQGHNSVNAGIKGTLSQMTQLYQAYAAYMKSRGLEPYEAIGDGAVLYDLDAKGLAGAGTPSDAGMPFRADASGSLDITGVSYPEDSFQEFAIEKLESLGYDEEEIGYAVSLWNYRNDVQKSSASAEKIYGAGDQLAEDLLEVDFSLLFDLMMDMSIDGEAGAKNAGELTAAVQDAITKLDTLHGTIDGYLPELQLALDDTSKVCGSLQNTTASLTAFLRTSRDILKSNSALMNDGTKRTLQGTADVLRKTADAVNSTDKVRKAKQSINDLVDDKWDEYTGEKNNLMKLDAEAAPESLTSPKNRNITSVSVLIRTDEIKTDTKEVHLQSADDRDRRTVWQRIGQMFSDFGHFLTGWMH